MADEFARSLTKSAIAEIIHNTGYHTIQKSAVNSLEDVLQQYIIRIGKASKESAEVSGRTQPTIVDVLMALKEAGPNPVELKDLEKALEMPTSPFPTEIPNFPVRKRKFQEKDTNFGKRQAMPAHVPAFLPRLPAHHTYDLNRKYMVNRISGGKETRLKLLSQNSQIQSALTKLVDQNPKAGDRAKMQEVFGGHLFNPMSERVTPSRDPSMPQLPRQDQGKEERILNGTFHEGDSE